jgi:hypothetical protein
MYLRFFRENAPLIGLLLAVVALAFAADKNDLRNGLLVFTGLFFIFVPLFNMRWRWHLLGKGERRFEVGMNLFFWIYGGASVYLGLTDPQPDTWDNLRWVGGGFVLFAIFMLFVQVIPLAAKKWKECPECCNQVLTDARVCQYCGYRWKPPLPSD